MRTAKQKAQRRRSDLARIHLGARQLCGDDRDAYEDMLEAVVGARSSKDLGPAGRRKVLAHLRACGVKFVRSARGSAPPRRSRPAPRPEIRRQLQLIDALCINHPGGRKPRAWAEGILQRMSQADHRTPLEWATLGQLHRVAQAIRIDIRRHERTGVRPSGEAA